MPDLSADPEDPFADPEDPFADPEDSSTNPNDPVIDPSPRLDCQEQGFKPKLITRSFEGLDFSYHDIDIVSFNVDNSKAPKGLQCSERITPSPMILSKGDSLLCPLCEDPGSSKLYTGLRKRQKEYRKEKEREEKVKGKREGREDTQEKGKEKAILQKSAQTGKSFVNGLKFQFHRRKRIADSSVQCSEKGWEQI